MLAEVAEDDPAGDVVVTTTGEEAIVACVAFESHPAALKTTTPTSKMARILSVAIFIGYVPPRNCSAFIPRHPRWDK